MQRRPAPPDVAAGTLRHRRPRAERDRVPRLPRRGRPAPVAGAAARADRLRRFAVSVLLRVRRQSAARSASIGWSTTACSPRPTRRGRRRDAAGRHRRRGRHVDFPAVIAHRRRAVAARARALRRDGAAVGARPVRGVLPRGGGVAGRLRALHGGQGRARPRGLDGVGAGHRPARSRGAARAGRRVCAREIRLHKLAQFLFFEQWHGAARARVARDGIAIMGDLPIFVAHDSADVWARRELFRLDADGQPTVVAGVPPDYFSATGQLWGNPHYRWDALARAPATPGGSSASARVLAHGRPRAPRSLPRLRGVVGGAARRATTAIDGQWVKGPGAALVRRAVQAALAPTACRSSPRTSA